MKEIKVFSGSSHPQLTEEICKELEISPSPLKIEEYENGCFEVILEDSIEGKTVFLVQTSRTGCGQLHKSIWELFQMIEACSLCSAREINVIMPYVSYARSDKKHKPKTAIDGEPKMAINGELLIKILESLGMKRFIGIDFHSSKFPDFFSDKTAVHSLYAEPLLVERLKERNLEKTILLPGDAGALIKANYISDQLGLPMGIVEKKRISDKKVKIKIVKGEVKNKNVIIFDDEISTGTTMKTLIEEAKKKGAREITVSAVHGVFAGKAVSNFKAIGDLKEIIITDTVPVSREAKESLPITVVSSAKLLADEIKKINKNAEECSKALSFLCVLHRHLILCDI